MAMTLQKNNPVRFRSFLDVAYSDVPSVDCHVEKVHQEHLEYNECGQVVKVVDPDFDLYALIQSYAADGDVISNIQRLARGDVSVHCVNPDSLIYGDSSSIPDNPVEMVDWLKSQAVKAAAVSSSAPSAAVSSSAPSAASSSGSSAAAENEPDQTVSLEKEAK